MCSCRISSFLFCFRCCFGLKIIQQQQHWIQREAHRTHTHHQQQENSRTKQNKTKQKNHRKSLWFRQFNNNHHHHQWHPIILTKHFPFKHTHTHRDREIYQKERIGTVTNCFFRCLFVWCGWLVYEISNFFNKKKIHNYPKQPKQKKTMV